MEARGGGGAAPEVAPRAMRRRLTCKRYPVPLGWDLSYHKTLKWYAEVCEKHSYAELQSLRRRTGKGIRI
jgi:hypothetical protein